MKFELKVHISAIITVLTSVSAYRANEHLILPLFHRVERAGHFHLQQVLNRIKTSHVPNSYKDSKYITPRKYALSFSSDENSVNIR